MKYIEHINVRREYSEHALNTIDNFDDNNNPLSILITKETERDAELAIYSLSTPYKEIITMRLEELSYQEIAEKLNIPVNSVGPLLNLARKMMRKILENKA